MIILLRMKWRFQIYISFVEIIKYNCKKLPESVLKRCRFYTYANNPSLWVKTLEYDIDSNIFGLLT